MLYLIVDPNVFLLSEAEAAQTPIVNEWLNHLNAVAELISEYQIKLGITELCSYALQQEERSILNDRFLFELTEREDVPDVATIVLALQPLMNELQSNPDIERQLSKLTDTQLFIYNTLEEQSALIPMAYIERLQSESLRQGFRKMLCDVVFARNQEVVPLAELRNVGIWTRYTPKEKDDWADKMQYRLRLAVNFAWDVEKTVPDYITLQALSRFEDDLLTYFTVEGLKSAAPVIRFSNMRIAIKTACEAYPEALIIPDKAYKSAKKQKDTTQNAAYHSIRGLAEVWLPAYLSNNGDPSHKFREEFGFEISNESATTNNNAYFRTQRSINHKGKSYYAERHIKLPESQRIYFVPIEDNGKTKLLITRVGAHPDNKATN